MSKIVRATQDDFTEQLVASIKAAAQDVHAEGLGVLQRDGNVAGWMRQRLDLFRLATARGDARREAGELISCAMWIDAYFKKWEADVSVLQEMLREGATSIITVVEKAKKARRAKGMRRIRRA